MKKKFHEIINNICNELNIKCTVLSKNWIIMLEKNNKTKFISGFKFDCNGHAMGNVVDDKYALYEVLTNKGIPVISHTILFRQSNNNEYAFGNNSYDKAFEYFKNHNCDIVVKANTGTCGTEVFHIKTEEYLTEILNKLFKNNFSISMCPYYDIDTEFRVIIFNGKQMYSYGKKRPILIGDGNKSVKELLLEFNYNYYKDDNFPNDKIDVNYVPKKDEIIEYNWQFNLSRGAQIIDIGNNQIKVEEIAIKVANEVGLKFGSVDIIKTNNEFLVLESNSGVMMENLIDLVPNGYNIAYNIYKEVIKDMFNK